MILAIAAIKGGVNKTTLPLDRSMIGLPPADLFAKFCVKITHAANHLKNQYSTE
jgi:hypothetical protein